MVFACGVSTAISEPKRSWCDLERILEVPCRIFFWKIKYNIFHNIYYIRYIILIYIHCFDIHLYIYKLDMFFMLETFAYLIFWLIQSFTWAPDMSGLEPLGFWSFTEHWQCGISGRSHCSFRSSQNFMCLAFIYVKMLNVCPIYLHSP